MKNISFSYHAQNDPDFSVRIEHVTRHTDERGNGYAVDYFRFRIAEDIIIYVDRTQLKQISEALEDAGVFV